MTPIAMQCDCCHVAVDWSTTRRRASMTAYNGKIYAGFAELGEAIEMTMRVLAARGWTP